MHDEAAHTSTPFVTPMKTVSQLGVFFTQSVRDWVKSISSKGFISMQVTSTFNPSPRSHALNHCLCTALKPGWARHQHLHLCAGKCSSWRHRAEGSWISIACVDGTATLASGGDSVQILLYSSLQRV